MMAYTDCALYGNTNPYGDSEFISGTTCDGELVYYYLNYGDTICMDNTKPMTKCNNITYISSCLSVTPTPTPTPGLFCFTSGITYNYIEFICPYTGEIYYDIYGKLTITIYNNNVISTSHDPYTFTITNGVEIKTITIPNGQSTGQFIYCKVMYTIDNGCESTTYDDWYVISSPLQECALGACLFNAYIVYDGNIPVTPTPTPTIPLSPTPTPTIPLTPTNTSSPTTTPTTTPTPSSRDYNVWIDLYGEGSPPGFSGKFVATAEVIYGTTDVNLNFDLSIFRYSTTNCTGTHPPDAGWGLYLPSGSVAGTVVHDDQLIPIGTTKTSKIVVMDILAPYATSITSSPQYVTIGSTIYKITGYGICSPL